MDYYLKAAREQDLRDAMEKAGIDDCSVDVIGSFFKVVGYDEEGNPILKECPEFHVNIRGTPLDEAPLRPFTIVPPEVPFRVWA